MQATILNLHKALTLGVGSKVKRKMFFESGHISYRVIENER